MRLGLGLILIALLAVGGQTAAAQTDCESARCAVQAAIDQECPCAAATNHGRHVSCVAHVVKRLSQQGQVPTSCKGRIKRCAARSICGKEGAVTCQKPVLGTCDLTTGTCLENGALLCTSDAECVVGTRCSTKRSTEQCTISGGTVGAGSTCCAECTVPTP